MASAINDRHKKKLMTTPNPLNNALTANLVRDRTQIFNQFLCDTKRRTLDYSTRNMCGKLQFPKILEEERATLVTHIERMQRAQGRGLTVGLSK